VHVGSGNTAGTGNIGGGATGVGQGGGSGGSSPVESIDSLLEISIRGAIIAPAAPDGKTWDGNTTVASDETNAAIGKLIATAVSAAADPYVAISQIIAKAANEAYDMPDVRGFAELNYEGQWEIKETFAVQTDTYNNNDTITPGWTDVSWVNVPYSKDLRVRITLFDQDVINDDSIGEVTLNAGDISAAYQSGTDYRVLVNNQGNGEILFVIISVSNYQQ
jgi:hypothetical protein